MNIIIEPIIKQVAPALKVIAIEAEVRNVATSDSLWEELRLEAGRIASLYQLPDINKRPGILATRTVYKALGKEPNRYRPSSEALCRRIVKGLELYRTLSVIDAINLVSIRSGYSIGGFDRDKIEGNTLCLGAGREGEEFNAIGRGLLNIAHLPVYRDAIGGIGTPTSDEERTKLSLDTRHLLMCVNIYGEELSVDDTINYSVDILKRHCDATCITTNIILP